jgi:hypothetical protein
MIKKTFLAVSFTFLAPTYGTIYSIQNMNITEFENNCDIFSISQSRPDDSSFYVNANFFDENGDPLRGLIINSDIVSEVTRTGGVFYIDKNGCANVDSIDPFHGETPYLVQSVLGGIHNGIPDETIVDSQHGRISNYRTLVGQRKDGSIVIVTPGILGLTTAQEILELSVEHGVYEGVLFDGGSSVDVRTSKYNHFRSIPNYIKSRLDIDEPPSYIVATIESM